MTHCYSIVEEMTELLYKSVNIAIFSLKVDFSSKVVKGGKGIFLENQFFLTKSGFPPQKSNFECNYEFLKNEFISFYHFVTGLYC